MPSRLLKSISLFLCLLLLFQQSRLAQVAAELNIAAYLASLHSALRSDAFRPLHLRYLTYDNLNNNFKLLLDKGDSAKGLSPNATPQVIKGTVPEEKLKARTRVLLNYFFVGISLPNDSFWVNLRPDSPDNIIDDWLAQTDVGKIMLESDLQLKKDTAKATSPETPEGKRYWDKLYKKAEELFGSEQITIPILTRPWIVPGEIIIRETQDSAYIYKTTLKVMLEEDHLRGTKDEGRGTTVDYSFSRQANSSMAGSRLLTDSLAGKDPRLKALNEYSSQLLRELIIPKLTKEVNTSRRYAPLRQVYYSLIFASWFKARFKQGLSPTKAVAENRKGTVPALIDSRNLTNLTSKDDWSKSNYFKAYQKSFKDGEYNIQQPVYTPYGQNIRSYFSGGMKFDISIQPFGMANGGLSPVSAVVAASAPVARNSEIAMNIQGTPEVGAGIQVASSPAQVTQQGQSPATEGSPERPKGVPSDRRESRATEGSPERPKGVPSDRRESRAKSRDEVEGRGQSLSLPAASISAPFPLSPRR